MLGGGDPIDLDRVLVARLQKPGGQADKEAWAALIQRHQKRVYVTCLRYCNNPETAADLTQDTCVKVIQSIGGFDGRSQLATWMTRIAINVCLSHRRSARIRKTVALPGEGGGPGEGRGSKTIIDSGLSGGSETENIRSGGTPGSGRGLGGGELSPGEGVQEGEERDRLYAALADLPAEQRALLILRDVQGLEYEQIAQVLDVPLGTLKSRLFRARLALRERIESMPGR